MSALWGTIDVAVTWYEQAVDNELRFFSDGFGDIEAYERVSEEWREAWRADGLETKLPNELAELRWSPVESQEGIWEDEAVWKSPLSEHLPAAGVDEGRLLFVRRAPRRGLRFPKTRSIVLHMTPLGDETYVKRHKSLAIPLLNDGIASLIYIPPYYGTRRPKGQTRHYVRTVAHFMLQTMAVILEGTQLLRCMSEGFSVRDKEYYKVPMGVTGISWGGAMAACVGLTSRRPVACVPCMGCSSMRVLINGLMKWRLDWDALMKERVCRTGIRWTEEQVAAELERIFSKVTFDTVFGDAPSPKANIISLVQVSASDDHVISAQEGEQLYEVLSQAVVQDGLSRVEWISGGHASSFVWRQTVFLPACADAMGELMENSEPPKVRLPSRAACAEDEDSAARQHWRRAVSGVKSRHLMQAMPSQPPQNPRRSRANKSVALEKADLDELSAFLGEAPVGLTLKEGINSP